MFPTISPTSLSHNNLHDALCFLIKTIVCIRSIWDVECSIGAKIHEVNKEEYDSICDCRQEIHDLFGKEKLSMKNMTKLTVSNKAVLIKLLPCIAVHIDILETHGEAMVGNRFFESAFSKFPSLETVDDRTPVKVLIKIQI